MSEKSAENCSVVFEVPVLRIDGTKLSYNDLQIMSRRLMGAVSPAQQAALTVLVVEVNNATITFEKFREKMEALTVYANASKRALQHLLAAIKMTARQTRFTGRSKPARRAMAKLAARRCR